MNKTEQEVTSLLKIKFKFKISLSKIKKLFFNNKNKKK